MRPTEWERADLDRAALEYLTESGELHEAAASITKLYLKHGDQALNGDRRRVFEKYVVEPYFTAPCKLCHHPIPGCERAGAWLNGGYCGACNHVLGKED